MEQLRDVQEYGEIIGPMCRRKRPMRWSSSTIDAVPYRAVQNPAHVQTGEVRTNEIGSREWEEVEV